MKASRMVRDIDSSILIGAEIVTQPFGEYPGGIAKIIALHPDPTAPEIPIQVKHPSFGEIGIFEHEQVYLVDYNILD